MKSLSRKAIAVSLLCAAISAAAVAQGGELRFCLRTEPKTFDPLKVDDDASIAIRYLTGGVLVRLNRQTQQLEPELALSWKVSKDGRQISFRLRSGVSFSDGTPFSAEDVAYTMQQLMDPALHSPTGDAFRSGAGNVETKVISPTQISIRFPAQVAGLDRLFDQVAILSAAFAEERNGCARPIRRCRLQTGCIGIAEAKSQLLEDGRAGPQASLPRLDSSGYSAESRCGNVAI